MPDKKEGKRGKRPPSATAMRLRRTLSANFKALLDDLYPLSEHRGKSRQEKEFAKDAGVSWSSVQRLLNPEEGKTLDVIADLAVALEVKASDLLSTELLKSRNRKPRLEAASDADRVAPQDAAIGAAELHRTSGFGTPNRKSGSHNA